MMVLNSIPGRFLMTFYALGLWLLAQHIKKQVRLLLEYNSTYWHISFYHSNPKTHKKA